MSTFMSDGWINVCINGRLNSIRNPTCLDILLCWCAVKAVSHEEMCKEVPALWGRSLESGETAGGRSERTNSSKVRDKEAVVN